MVRRRYKRKHKKKPKHYIFDPVLYFTGSLIFLGFIITFLIRVLSQNNTIKIIFLEELPPLTVFTLGLIVYFYEKSEVKQYKKNILFIVSILSFVIGVILSLVSRLFEGSIVMVGQFYGLLPFLIVGISYILEVILDKYGWE